MKKIYTRREAANIVEMFEDVLSERDISVPSDEDDERDEDDEIGLYGSTYYGLLDEIETLVGGLLTGDTAKTVSAKAFAMSIVNRFKDTLDGYTLSIPEVSEVGCEREKFVGEIADYIAGLAKRAEGARLVWDDFGDELAADA